MPVLGRMYTLKLKDTVTGNRLRECLGGIWGRAGMGSRNQPAMQNVEVLCIDVQVNEVESKAIALPRQVVNCLTGKKETPMPKFR